MTSENVRQERVLYQPEQYGIVLFFMVVSMLCWGSWANPLKLCPPPLPLQLRCWDYTIGLVVGALLRGFTRGGLGHAGPGLSEDLRQMERSSGLRAAAGGAAREAIPGGAVSTVSAGPRRAGSQPGTLSPFHEREQGNDP